MRTQIIIFKPKDFGIWESESVLDIPEVTAITLKGEFFGSKAIKIIPEPNEEESKMKYYLFSRN